MRATFLLSKDPRHESTGDLTMAKLVIGLARESYEAQIICLSSWPDDRVGTLDGVPVRAVLKRAPRPLALLAKSALHRRSLVHARFVSAELVAAVEQADTDVFVADHCYMAEAVLESRRFATPRESMLAVNTVVPEALVWTATRGVIGRLDAKRIVRDEVRVARSAYAVGTYDKPETEFYEALGLPRTHWLDLTLPADKQVPVRDTTRRLLFLGDRRWAPNHDAYVELLALWPRIAAGIEGAELAIVGAPDPTASSPPLPDGVSDLGFVDDLDAFVATCRAMVAPIRTGGGVRVKILDAASRGLPVVGTSPAVGSLDGLLGIECLDDQDDIVERCRQYLLDPAVAADHGETLYRINEARWVDRKPHVSVENWLRR